MDNHMPIMKELTSGDIAPNVISSSSDSTTSASSAGDERMDELRTSTSVLKREEATTNLSVGSHCLKPPGWKAKSFNQYQIGKHQRWMMKIENQESGTLIQGEILMENPLKALSSKEVAICGNLTMKIKRCLTDLVNPPEKKKRVAMKKVAREVIGEEKK